MKGLILNPEVLSSRIFEDGDIVSFFQGASIDLAKVHHDDQGRPCAKMLAPANGDIEINDTTSPYVRNIALTNEVLELLSVYGDNVFLDEQFLSCYAITMKNGTVVKFIRNTNESFRLIIEAEESRPQREISFEGLDGLQKAIRAAYKINFCPSKKALDEIKKHLNNQQ